MRNLGTMTEFTAHCIDTQFDNHHLPSAVLPLYPHLSCHLNTAEKKVTSGKTDIMV